MVVIMIFKQFLLLNFLVFVSFGCHTAKQKNKTTPANETSPVETQPPTPEQDSQIPDETSSDIASPPPSTPPQSPPVNIGVPTPNPPINQPPPIDSGAPSSPKPTKITISGLSSGAFLAVQLQVARSDLFSGVGSIAGGPSYCAESGGVLQGFNDCLSRPSQMLIEPKVKYIQTKIIEGSIAELKNDIPVYIFKSKLDPVVGAGAGQQLQKFFNLLNPTWATFFEEGIDASHAIPTLNKGSACQFLGKPWINNCNFDLVGQMWGVLMGNLKPRIQSKLENLTKWPQDQLIEKFPEADFQDSGFVYTPSACKEKKCDLHIALHGCEQSKAYVQKQFATDSGYNEWAESNNIVVIYPQVAATFGANGNPNGCWDWWGYTGKNYANSKGPQMAALISVAESWLK
jgi:hypothetical protein